MNASQGAILVMVFGEVGKFLNAPGAGLLIGVGLVWLICSRCPHKGEQK